MKTRASGWNMDNYITGADVSFWQDDPTTSMGIDFQIMAKTLSFVNIRAGQGSWVDRAFATSWKNAKLAGLPRGSYWFYDSRYAPRQQARKWIEALGGDIGELPLWCDFEDTYFGAFHGWRHWFDFMDELMKFVPRHKVGVYTGYYYFKENTLDVGIPRASLEWFADFPLWIAWYNKSQPLIPQPWKSWTLWQYTDDGDGTSLGVESREIDLNYFSGTLPEFQKFFGIDGGTIEEKPEIEIGEPMTSNYIFKRTDGNGAALRTAPNALGVLNTKSGAPSSVITLAGYIMAGVEISGDTLVTLAAPVKDSRGALVGNQGDKWLHVTSIGGYVVDGYTAVVHLGKSQGTLQELPTEPTPTPTPDQSGTDPDVNVIVNVDTSRHIVTITTDSQHDWQVYVDGNPYLKS